jgi:predicted nucleic acid-binding protein
MPILDFHHDLPEIAYGDPSFFVALLESGEQFHHECVAFSTRLQAAGSILLLSALGVDEIWFALLRIHASVDYGREAWFRTLKDDPGLMRNYVPFLEQANTTLESLPHLLFVDVTVEQALGSFDVLRLHGLFPRDAIHVSIARRSGVNSLLTTNRDYTRVADLDVYTCNPAVLAPT